MEGLPPSKIKTFYSNPRSRRIDNNKGLGNYSIRTNMVFGGTDTCQGEVSFLAWEPSSVKVTKSYLSCLPALEQVYQKTNFFLLKSTHST